MFFCSNSPIHNGNVFFYIFFSFFGQKIIVYMPWKATDKHRSDDWETSPTSKPKKRLTKAKQEKTSILLHLPLHLTHLLGSMFSKCYKHSCRSPNPLSPQKTIHAHMIRHHAVLVPLFTFHEHRIRLFAQLCHCRWPFAEPTEVLKQSFWTLFALVSPTGHFQQQHNQLKS